MARLRTRTIQRLHGLLALATDGWRDHHQPVLRLYLLGHGAFHLRAANEHDRLWMLLQDETYRAAQLQALGQYTAGYAALRQGLALYVQRNGATDADDPRLCWLALRAAILAEEAMGDITQAFRWAEQRPLDDPTLVLAALERIGLLTDVEFYRAAVLVLWIEVERQAEVPAASRSTAGAQSVIHAVATRIPRGGGVVDWSRFLSERFMAWYATRILDVLPELRGLDQILSRSSVESIATLTRLMIASVRTAPASADAAGDVASKRARRACEEFLSVISQGWTDLEELVLYDALAHALNQAGERELAGEITHRALRTVQELAPGAQQVEVLRAICRRCIEAGNLEAALRVAGMMPDGASKAIVLAALADAHTAAREVARARWLLLQARRVIVSLTTDTDRPEPLAALVSALAGAGDVEAAAAAAASITDEQWRSAAFYSVGRARLSAGETDAALAIAGELRDSYRGTELLGVTAAALGGSGQREQARALIRIALRRIRSIRGMWWKADLLSTVAKSVSKLPESMDRMELFREALAIAPSIQGARWRAAGLIGVADAFTAVGTPAERSVLLGEATRTARTMPDDEGKVEALSALTRLLSAAGDAEQARASAAAALDVANDLQGFLRTRAVSEVVSVIATADPASGRRIFEQSTERPQESQPRWPADLMIVLARVLGEVPRSWNPGRILGQVLDSARQLESVAARVRVLTVAGRALLSANEEEHALRVLEDVVQTLRTAGDINVYDKRDALADLAGAVAESKRPPDCIRLLDEVEAVARSIGPGWWEVAALAAVAKAASDMGDEVRAERIFRLARQQVHAVSATTNESQAANERLWRAEGLAALAAELAKTGRFIHAFETGAEIDRSEERATAFAAIGHALAGAKPTPRERAGLAAKVRQLLSELPLADIDTRIGSAPVEILFHLGETDLARTVCDRLFLEASETGHEPSALDALLALARALIVLGDSDRAARVLEMAIANASSREDDWMKASGLVLLAGALVRAECVARRPDLFARTLAAADQIRNAERKADAIAAVARGLAAANMPDAFHAYARSAVLPFDAWKRVLSAWRVAVLEHLQDPQPYLRATFGYAPFVPGASVDGVRAVQIAHLTTGDLATIAAISERCTATGFPVIGSPS